MKLITLTKGLVASVDDSDFERISCHRWHACGKAGGEYAARTTHGEDGKKVMVYMHREIIGAESTLQVDHVDGNRLNNVRANIRLATTTQNLWNRPRYKNNLSGFKGVSFHRTKGLYMARIVVNGRQICLGYFVTPELAHEAHKRAAIKHFGEFAHASLRAA